MFKSVFGAPAVYNLTNATQQTSRVNEEKKKEVTRNSGVASSPSHSGSRGKRLSSPRSVWEIEPDQNAILDDFYEYNRILIIRIPTIHRAKEHEEIHTDK